MKISFISPFDYHIPELALHMFTVGNINTSQSPSTYKLPKRGYK
jgi:hypothetical protein